MARSTSNPFEFLKPHEFAKEYPDRAQVLDDDVLSKYVSWALVDRSGVSSGKTYLLMTVAAYRKACYRFAPMTDDFARQVKLNIEAPLRASYDEIKKCEETIGELENELAEYREIESKFNINRKLITQEAEAVLMLKGELQRLIERLKNGDGETPRELLGFFARLDEMALDRFTKEAWKKTHRRSKNEAPQK